MTRLAFLASTLALVALPAAAQNYGVRFVNNSGETVYRLYMSAAYENEWEADRLGRNVLYSGSYFDMLFVNVQNCAYDVLVEWESGYQEQHQVDVCSYNEFVIN